MARVIIVSNRLPVSVKKQDGQLVFSQSTGGVATGLSSYANNPNNRWIGWPGIASDDLTATERREIERELARHNCIGVFLTKKQIDDFYNGYSNSILWPLFHNLPVTAKAKAAREDWFRGYRAVNRLFAQAILRVAQKNSRIWVHDYQLLLVPELLRDEQPTADIGFFSHIPFPRPKVFTTLPEAQRLVRGMLGAQLVGFHTTSYVNNFLDTCEALDAGTIGKGQIVLADRLIRVADFPMGIDYQKYAQSGNSAAVRAAVLKYKLRYRRQKVIVAVDRLDPSKGLVERLEAYREFLRQHPELQGKVVLAMIAAASRTDIDTYQKLARKLESLVTAINDEFGTRRWQPIDFTSDPQPFEEVSALMRIADVAFIAPIRDGMNLVAKEYIASRRKTGVLILSETAGAAQELSDALLVNPALPATVVAALEQAFSLPRREVKKRLKAMQAQLSTNTVQEWAGSFMQTLQQPMPGSQTLRTPSLSDKQRVKLLKSYRLSSKRLLLVDYDGTLQPHTEDYNRAKPSEKLLKLLQKLGDNARNEVVIISGRSQANLQEWFGDLPVGLVAEHGAVIKSAGHKTWRETGHSGRRWKKNIQQVLEHYAALTPGSQIEIKQYSVVWHYRQSPPFAAQKNLQILHRVLRPLAREYGLELFDGSKILEIKDPAIHKGSAVRRWLRHDHDFVLAIGDDFTDEDLFAALPASATSIKVGRGRTTANYRLATSTLVFELLTELSDSAGTSASRGRLRAS